LQEGATCDLIVVPPFETIESGQRRAHHAGVLYPSGHWRHGAAATSTTSRTSCWAI
jgi:hypothetical protein